MELWLLETARDTSCFRFDLDLDWASQEKKKKSNVRGIKWQNGITNIEVIHFVHLLA